jgi:hypothetical protein
MRIPSTNGPIHSSIELVWGEGVASTSDENSAHQDGRSTEGDAGGEAVVADECSGNRSASQSGKTNDKGRLSDVRADLCQC